MSMKGAAASLLACLLAGAVCARLVNAEPGGDLLDRLRGDASASADELLEIRNAQTVQDLRRASAHALQAAISESPSIVASCPVTGATQESVAPRRSKEVVPHRFAARNAPPPSRWTTVASPHDSAQTVFRDHLSNQVIQSRCVKCHVQGGLSDYTRLVFESSSVADHSSRNLAALEAFVSTVPSGADIILDKIRGVAHGGAVQVPAGSADFANMERFLRLLDGATGGSALSPETLFDGVTMSSPAKTLRRAALVLAGRMPTESEVASVGDGSASSLRRAIRGLMRGKAFHDFLIRASNDRLLTDRHLFSVLDIRGERDLVDLANLSWQAAKESIGRGYERALDDASYATWEGTVQFGMARAPLELIAHVVENDLPYTEILTADYIMANPVAAKGYGASTRFDTPASESQFRPSRIVNYFRNDYSKIAEFDVRYGTRVVNSGNLETRYPHAGILNTRVYLRRYPTTATNRNRARARWTLFHFLGMDVEDLASRPTDPRAIADTDNPTMRNPSCTACHSVLDPVAGAFQNYDEEGAYRSAFGGRDSLPRTYKVSLDGTPSLYRDGDTWYRDMVAPGFDGETVPDSRNSVQWLARKIAGDGRFATAAVKFWWPALMGREITMAPKETVGSAAQGQLLASQAQAAEVVRLGTAFHGGIAGGSPYNARDLLAEMALSPWFRAESVVTEDPVRRAALQDAGAERLLTPEELARKTDSITGYRWGRRTAGFIHEIGNLDGEGAGTGGPYELLYGGIDSDGMAKRARSVTPLMAAVAQGHAIRTSCAIVQREFFMWSDEERRLFHGIDAEATPLSGLPPRINGAAPWAGEDTPEGEREPTRVRSPLRRRLSNEGLEHPSQSNRAEGDAAGTLEILGPLGRPMADALRAEADQDPRSGPVQIRKKLVDLHWKLFGVTVDMDSPDIEAAYRLFVDVWNRKRRTEGAHFSDSRTQCPIEDTWYFAGILEDVVVSDEWGNSKIDWTRVRDSWDFDMDDSTYTVRTWTVVLAYLMTDYRYLHL